MKYPDETRSQKFMNAVEALEQLLKSEDLDSVERVFAQVVKGRRRQKIRQYLKAVARVGHVCTFSLLGGECQPEACLSPMDLPALDHLIEWTKRGKTIAITSEPYDVSWEELQHAVAYCRENGLRLDIDGSGAAHFPSRTLHLIYRPNDAL